MTTLLTHILLDLDGTLVNSVDIFHKVDRKLFSQAGITIEQHEFDQMQMKDGFKILIEILDKKSKLSIEEKNALMLNILAESHETIKNKIDWYEDVENFITESKKRGYELAVITRSTPKDFIAMEHRLPIREMFNIVVHGEDTKGRHKPHPYPLLLASERLKVKPENCLYVGDHIDDLISAKEAGMKSCLILRSHVPEKLIQYANFAVKSLNEIHPTILKNHPESFQPTL